MAGSNDDEADTCEGVAFEIDAGRRLGFSQYGDPAGRPVLYCHGGLSCRVDARVTGDACRKAGIRLLAVDRPGIGLSSPKTDRRLIDWASDVDAFLNAVGVATVDVIGWSAGGPYALACALRLPHRIGAVITVGGMIPVDTPGRVRELGLAADRLLFPLSRRAPAIAAMALTAVKLAGRRAFHRSMLQALRSPADRALVASWSRRDATDFFFEALRPGANGTVWDFAVLGQDWGFRLEDVSKPVRVVQGAEDDLLPRSHAVELAARLPGGALHLIDEAGHYAFHHRPEIVLALLP